MQNMRAIRVSYMPPCIHSQMPRMQSHVCGRSRQWHRQRKWSLRFRLDWMVRGCQTTGGVRTSDKAQQLSGTNSITTAKQPSQTKHDNNDNATNDDNNNNWQEQQRPSMRQKAESQVLRTGRLHVTFPPLGAAPHSTEHTHSSVSSYWYCVSLARLGCQCV